SLEFLPALAGQPPCRTATLRERRTPASSQAAFRCQMLWQVGTGYLTRSFDECGEWAVGVDNWLKQRIRYSDFLRPGSVGGDLVSVECDLQPFRRDVPTVVIFQLGARAVANPFVVADIELLDFLNAVIGDDFQVVRIRLEQIGQLEYRAV